MEEHSLYINSPQNVELEYHFANLGERMSAYLIDMVILAAYYILMGVLVYQIVINQGISLDPSVFFIITLPSLIYRPVCEILLKGQTIGKRQQKIQVMRLDGNPCTPFDYLLRWVMQPLDFYLGGGPAILSMSYTATNQRLGDLAAGTTVVRESTPDNPLHYGKQNLQQEDPVFPQAASLTSQELRLIEETIKRNRRNYNPQMLEFAAEKIKERLQISYTGPPLKLLYQVVNDYRLASEKLFKEEGFRPERKDKEENHAQNSVEGEQPSDKLSKHQQA